MGAACPVRSQLGRQGVVMFPNKTKVLLILTQDVLDRARVLAGEATTALKLPVSLRSEEHTSELQSQSNLVCRLLLEKKKKEKRKRVAHVYTLQHPPHGARANTALAT